MNIDVKHIIMVGVGIFLGGLVFKFLARVEIPLLDKWIGDEVRPVLGFGLILAIIIVFWLLFG